MIQMDQPSPKNKPNTKLINHFNILAPMWSPITKSKELSIYLITIIYIQPILTIYIQLTLIIIIGNIQIHYIRLWAITMLTIIIQIPIDNRIQVETH